jgi:uncharacterized low-complexity protein
MKSRTILAIGTTLTLSLAAASVANADTNPFTANKVTTATQQTADTANTAGDAMDKAKKSMDASCGAGKCGANKKECPQAKMKEAKCGAGKCGGAKKAASDTADKAKEAVTNKLGM